MEHPKDIFTSSLELAIPKQFNLTKTEVGSSISYCDPSFGEFATNIVFRLAKSEGKSPAELAEGIVKSLNNDKSIKKAEFMAPGFINVVLQNQAWVDYLASINQDFAQSKKGGGKSIQIEFISANPTGPLVLTNVWQGYYGDILTNIYASQGYKTEREYYLNDGGNQVISLGRAIQQALGMEFEAEISENLYRGNYIDDVARAISTEFGGDDAVKQAEPSQLGKRAAEIIVEDYIRPDLDRLGVKFDSIYSETKPDVQKLLARLKDAGLSKQKDGATWLDGAKVGLNQDEVLVRSYDNDFTYFLKDIAYQLERLEERGFDQTITIVGPDHHGQAIRLINTLKALGHAGFTEISTQTIRLIKDGKEFKMSKRKGNYILLDEFLDMVPTEAARFYFAMRDTNTHMDFDIDLIKEHSAKNPVYYSLYAYARACSIQNKAKEEGLGATSAFKNYDLTKEEKKLALEISKIPLVLSEIVENQKVHQLVHQTFELAKAFHEYYESEKVLTSLNANQKLKIIEHFKSAYESVFAIIGVSLLERM
jgi:arginyl-tRNA synthetase